MAWYHFSKTANANGSSDPSQNWLENMPPGAVNDFARALLAASAAYRDDVAGGTVTSGTSQAFILNTFSNFTSAAVLANQLVAFTPHTTNGVGPVTMTIDSIPNIPLRSGPGKELLAGVLIQGTPYCAVFNQTDNALYLQSSFGNPFNVPLGAGMDYWFPTAPSSAFAFPIGQAISRTTYAAFFAAVGVTYGPGDGSTTFNLPDKRGRVSVGLDSAGRLANVFAGNALGAAGGADTQTLNAGQIPTITAVQNGIAVSTTLSVTVPSASVWTTLSGNTSGGDLYPGTHGGAVGFTNPTASGAINVATTSNNTGGGSHPNVQPTIACNYVIRVL